MAIEETTSEDTSETTTTEENPKPDAFDSLKGDSTDNVASPEDKITNEDGTHEKPEWLDKAFFDEKTGDVDIEKLQKSEKAAKTALREKQSVPQPTTENPVGYNVDSLVNDVGKEGDTDFKPAIFTEEYINSDEFKGYALEANEQGISQQAFEWQLEKFTEWKNAYDYDNALDLNSPQIIDDYKGIMTEQYGKDTGQQNWEFMAKWSNDPENVHPNIRRTLGMSAEGLAMLTDMSLGKLSDKGIINKDAVDTGPHQLKDITNKLTTLRLERDKLQDGDKKDQLNDQIRELTKQKTSMSPARRQGTIHDKQSGMTPSAPSDNWAAETQAKQKYKKLNIAK